MKHRAFTMFVVMFTWLWLGSAWAQSEAGKVTTGETNPKARNVAPDKGRNATSYFGSLKHFNESDIADLESELRGLKGKCKTIEQDCAEGVNVLRLFFGDLYNATYPDVLIFVDKENDKLKIHQPLLLWNGKNTPYLYGVQHVWVVIFSKEELPPLQAILTSLYSKPGGPFAGLFKVFNISIEAKEEFKEKTTDPQDVSWVALGGKEMSPEDQMYFSFVRFAVDPVTVNRVSVVFKQREPEINETKTTTTNTTKETKTTTTNTTKKTETTTTNITKKEELDRIEEKKKLKSTERITKKPSSVDFSSVHANFSNSKSSYFGVGLGIGLTYKVKSTALGENDRYTHVNAYVLSKLYLVRPKLQVGPTPGGIMKRSCPWRPLPWRALYCPSIALFAGTNIAGSIFDEIVYGLSIGHLLGKTGIMIGMNSIEPSEKSQDGQKQRLIFGVEYSF